MQYAAMIIRFQPSGLHVGMLGLLEPVLGEPQQSTCCCPLRMSAILQAIWQY
jgi:hypothetical protein